MTELSEFMLDALGVRAGERLSVIADRDREATARAIRRGAAGRGAESELVITTDDYRDQHEMPEDAVEATRSCDVLFLLVSAERAQFGGHATFRREATARGARVAFVVSDELPAEPRRLAGAVARTRALAGLLGEATSAVIRSPAGTELHLDLTGRPGCPFVPELTAPGDWGALPDYMEAAAAPLEGTSHGTVVVDGTCTHTGIQVEPMVLEVREGQVISLRGGAADRLGAYLDAAGDGGRNVAELGIGTNDCVGLDALAGTFVDKRIAGTAHLGIGDNRSLGGVTSAAIHTDVQMLSATVELDGRSVVGGGQVLVP